MTHVESRRSSTPPHMPGRVLGGMSMAIGSLPHRSIVDAVVLSQVTTDIVTIPSLPRRSPAESMIAQALVGMSGVSVGQYGSIAIDTASIDTKGPVRTDLDHDAFGGFRGFLDGAGDFNGPVKWQFVGPITLGLALHRAGIPAEEAFDAAMRAVRAHTTALLNAVAAAFPYNEQIVVLDEPELGAVLDTGFPIAPDSAIDLLSGALAIIEPFAVAGVHCCSDADWPSMIAAGPSLLSIPARPSLVENAGHIERFLESGGWIAWGAVPTDGPLPTSASRPWKQLSELWCQLVRHGCSPALLRQRALITPECGLGLHNPSVAERLLRINADLSGRVRDQAAATRLSFGA